MSAFDSKSTALPGGLTNAAPWQTMAKAGSPDPTWAQQYHHEFNSFAAADFTLSGTGAPAVALNATGGPGGVIGLSTSAAGTDSAHILQPVGSFQLTPGKHLFFKARIQIVANGAAAQQYVGLSINAANGSNSSDNLVFIRTAANYVLRSTIGSVVTDTPLPAACVLADGTWVELGFHVDPAGNVEFFWNPTTGNNQPASGGFRGRVLSVTPNLTQALLAVCAGMGNVGSAIARTLLIDYLTVSAER